MYKCEFPGCDYGTRHRSQINDHHIIPVEHSGSDKRHNRIILCPTHHTKVFIENASSGMHTTQGEDSIILIGWLKSTRGKILEYIDSDGEHQYY